MARNSGERHPLAEIIEVLGTKWVMRIIWELRDGPLTFRALQTACGDLSPSVLNSRLKLLEANELVTRCQPSGYALTGWGRELLEVYQPLGRWAGDWAAARRGS